MSLVYSTLGLGSGKGVAYRHIATANLSIVFYNLIWNCKGTFACDEDTEKKLEYDFPCGTSQNIYK